MQQFDTDHKRDAQTDGRKDKQTDRRTEGLTAALA